MALSNSHRLKVLAERFLDIDQNAHKVIFMHYQKQLEEAIRDALSD